MRTLAVAESSPKNLDFKTRVFGDFGAPLGYAAPG
jgi:hypothetical protein